VSVATNSRRRKDAAAAATVASVHKGENDDIYSDEAFHRRITDKMTDASASLWALLAAFLYSGVESFSVGCRLLR